MTTLGWLIFLVSNIAVITLVVFCFRRVLSVDQEHMHSPVDIDTHDLNGNGKDAPLNSN